MANGIVKLSAVCVGVRGRQREDPVLGRYSGRCPLLLRGAEGPRLGGTQLGAVRKESQGRRTKRKPSGPSPGRPGTSPLPPPQPKCAGRATQLRPSEASVLVAAAAAAAAAAAGGGRRRREGEGSGAGTVTPEPKRAAPEPREPESGPASRGARLEEGSSRPSPPPRVAGRDQRSKCSVLSLEGIK